MKHSKAFFIVFSPEGTSAPVVVHKSHKEALAIAWEMARLRPGQTFFVMGSMSRPCVRQAVDPDAATGCADDQTFADVPVEALREHLAGEP